MKLTHYPQALFFAHLTLEKLLKALYIDHLNSFPPKSHNLLILVQEIGVILPEHLQEAIIEINTFNVETRYPDIKFRFYKKCSADFSLRYMKIVEEIKKWLRRKLSK